MFSKVSHIQRFQGRKKNGGTSDQCSDPLEVYTHTSVDDVVPLVTDRQTLWR